MGSIVLSLKSTVKEENRNSLTFVFTIATPQSLSSTLSSLNFSSLLAFDSQACTITSTDYSSNELTVNADYSSSLKGTQLTLLFAPSESNSTALKLQNSSALTFAVEPQNNLAAVYFQDSDYELASAVKYFSIAVGALFLLLFLFGFVGGKVVSL